MAEKKNIALLLARPKEPNFLPKGPDNTVFEAPANYVIPRYKKIAPQIVSRFSANTVEVKEIAVPDLKSLLELKRDDQFSLFIRKHSEWASSLISLFLSKKNYSDLQSLAVYVRDKVNPYLFNYALCVALLNHPETQNLDIPNAAQTFPEKFVDPKVLSRAREEVTVVPEGQRMAVEIPVNYTASDLLPEQHVAYFREDLGVNLHHWHWHLVYPFQAPINVVNKDRRGELFYYMHEQMMARYNTERLCNNLPITIPFSEWRAGITEAYFPKLDSSVASRNYPGRVTDQKLQDIDRTVEGIRVLVEDMFTWRDRITMAINARFVVDGQGARIPLDDFKGIDILGNIVESSVLSANRPYYGDIHNTGHIMLAYMHDPKGLHLEDFGVMGDTTTAMRDPIFYRWHDYINKLFLQLKNLLTPYPVDKLNNPGISITGVSVKAGSEANNVLRTFWQKSDLDMSLGLDFQPRGPMFVRFTHLQNTDFVYTINVNNSSGQIKNGTCRIFLCAKNSDLNTFNKQRTMFIEMDKFTVNLRLGSNVITRKSTDSSVTIPFDRTFNTTVRPAGGEAQRLYDFCSCGWPQHMLSPKGTPQGFLCDLFVMISNYTDDNIVQDVTGACNDASSYCGIRDKLYPDARSMGYPFDRVARTGVTTLAQFITPNMYVQEVKILHSNTTVSPPTLSTVF